MLNPIKQVFDFNHKAGLVDKGYDDFLESSFQVEEALEGFALPTYIDIGIHDYSNHKELARAIVGSVIRDENNIDLLAISDVDRLDKACDAVIFAIGSMTKLGLNPNQITRALNVVMQTNLAKLEMPKDSHGKLTKPINFEGPEGKLQAILDERV